MALNGAVLYNSTGQYLNLNDFSGGFGIDWSAAIGKSDIRRTITKPWQRGYDPLSAVSWGNRVIKLPLHFGGTSLDSWSQNYQCVRHILAESERWYASNGTDGAQTWLAVQLNGQTNPLVFDVIGGEVDIDSGPQKYFGPTMVSTTSPKLPATPVILFCRPFAHPQAQQDISSTTLGNGNNQTYPTNYLQPTALGNWEPPARFSITPNSAYNLLIVARRSQGNVANFIWPYLANTSSARTGYTTSVGAFTGPSTTSYPWYPAALAGTPTFTNTAAVTASYMGTTSRWSGIYSSLQWVGATYTFTVNGNLIDQIGNHRMMVAASSNSFLTYGLTTVGCQLTYGGTDGRAVALPTSTYFPGTSNFYNTDPGQFILDAGVLPVTFPQTGTPGSFKFCIHIWGLPANVVAPGTAQSILDVDAVFPMPLDEQQFQYHAAYTASGGSVTWTSMAANTTFVKDDISLLPSFTNLATTGDQTDRVLVPDYDSGRFLMPLAPSRWFPLWWLYGGSLTNKVTISNFYTGTSTLNIKYTPLFEVTN